MLVAGILSHLITSQASISILVSMSLDEMSTFEAFKHLVNPSIESISGVAKNASFLNNYATKLMLRLRILSMQYRQT